jgi:hypothetical protein
MDQDEKQILNREINYIQKSLSSPRNWYTGLTIKKYLKEQVFSLNENFHSPVIESGRWSAYAHQSLLTSFKNLISKQDLPKGKIKVLVNPLTPPELVSYLIDNFDCQILGLDIDKNTLNWDISKAEKIIQEEKVDLIVNYSFNGLVKDVLTFLEKSNQKTVPTILILDNPVLNYETLDLFEKHKLGSLIWQVGFNPLNDIFERVTDEPPAPADLYVSWHFENRTSSLLEYHLSESHEAYYNILEALLFLLVQEYKKAGLEGTLYNLFSRHLLLKKKFKTKEEAINFLTKNYHLIEKSAVPDVFFDISKDLTDNYLDHLKVGKLDYFTTMAQNKTRELYDFFAGQINQREQGSLEVPELFMEKVYLVYHIYTTEQKYWSEYFSYREIKTYNKSRLHPLFTDPDKYPNAIFVRDYLIGVDIESFLDKKID